MRAMKIMSMAAVLAIGTGRLLAVTPRAIVR